MEMKQFNVRLPDEQIEAINLLAVELSTNQAGVIGHLLTVGAGSPSTDPAVLQGVVKTLELLPAVQRARIRREADEREAAAEASGCEHKATHAVVGGLLTCDLCGALRGADDAWRAKPA